MARWKVRGRIPISANWTFFASSHGWGARSGYSSKLCCLKAGVGQFERKGGSSTNDFWRQKTRVPGLSGGVVCVILRLAVDTIPACDTQTDTRWWLLPAQSQLRAGKNASFEPPFGGLRGIVHGSSMAHRKARGRLPISSNWIFLARSHGCGTIKRNLSKSEFSEGVGRFERKSLVDVDVARNPSMDR